MILVLSLLAAAALDWLVRHKVVLHLLAALLAFLGLINFFGVGQDVSQ